MLLSWRGTGSTLNPRFSSLVFAYIILEVTFKYKISHSLVFAYIILELTFKYEISHL